MIGLNTIVLMPGFDADVMPLALSANGLVDLRNRGYFGTIEGLEDVEVLGQPP